MQRKFRTLLVMALLLPTLAWGQDVVVTRYFTGLWDQVQHENQGINLQVVDQASGEKVGVAYWFTYGSDMQSAWYIGIGPVVENRIEMTLYEVADVGFLEPDDPDADPVQAVGTMEIEFSSCSMGEVHYDTSLAGVGSGSFDVQRLTDLYNTQCSGGVSDDTPSTVLVSEQRIGLSPARQGIAASGHADFEERPDRTEFSVEAEDLPDGSYRIFVGGVDRGELVVSLGQGETEFRSPVEAGKVLLTFDPRGQVVEVHDGQGAVLTSGDATFEGGDDNGGDDNGGDDNGGDDNGGDDNGGDDNGGDDNGGDDNGGDDNGGDDNGGDDNGGDDNSGTDIDFGSVDIEVELQNTGVYPAASGDAKLEPRDDRTDFSVEIEDVPVGPYDLRIGGTIVGTIEVRQLADGSIEGELEFRDPVEPGKILLDFDPRGEQIDVLEGSTVVLEVLFPNS